MRSTSLGMVAGRVAVRVIVGVRAGPTGFLVLLGVTTGLAVGVGAHA